MVWFRVDDKFHGHRKVRALGRGRLTARSDVAAVGVWTLTGTWSADHLEDGFVPGYIVEDYDPKLTLAALLVRAGLWVASEKRGEAGFQFVNWQERQPTRAKVLSKREADRERLRKWREKHAGNATGNSVTHGVGNTAPDPTRPDLLTTTQGGDRPVTLRAADATGSPKRSLCTRHPNGNPNDEPCGGCARDREAAERDAERSVLAAADAERRAREQCQDCGGGVWLDDGTKCTHPKTRRTA